MSRSENRVTWDPKRFLVLALLGLCMVWQGCASGGSNPFDEERNMDGFILRVESRHLREVSVYARVSGKRQLIGTVPGNGMEFMEFGYPAGRPITLELETAAGDRYRLQPQPVMGGGRLELVVGANLRRSGFIEVNAMEGALAG